jgi:RNA polymerase-interacting CarD/CdnL/TRCF family regulator
MWSRDRQRIEDKAILGTTCGFYHLRIVANDTTVLVPVSNVAASACGAPFRMRSRPAVRPAGRQEDRQPSELEGRFKDNSDKMRSGSI